MKKSIKPLYLSVIALPVGLLTDPCAGAGASIGVNFAGGGSHGAPTSLARHEEAGVVPQVEWNNFGQIGVTNSLLRDTTHQVTAITLTYSSSGVWGSGAFDSVVGTTNANAKLLNGFINALGGETSSVTFTGLVPEQHYSVVVYTLNEASLENATYWFNEVSDPFDGALPIICEGALDWTFAPEFRRVTNSLGAPELGNYVRWDNVPPRPDGSLSINVTAQSFRGPINAIQLISTNTFPPTTQTPAIVLQPRNVSVHPNERGTFRLVVDGPWSFQWYSNDVAIAGADSDTFTTEPLADELGTRAQYKVVVSSGATQVTSDAVHLILVPALPPGGIFYDAFNYPVGILGNWGEWSLENIATVTSPGLTYFDGTNTLQVSGNSLIPPREPGGWNDVKYIPVKSFGTTVYGGPNSTNFMSFLYDFRDLTAAGGIGVSGFLGIGDWGNERFFVGKVSGQVVIGLDSGPPRTLSEFTIYTNAFVVLRITQNDATATFDLFINPLLSGLPDVPTISAVKTDGTVQFDGVGVNAGDWGRADPSGPGPMVDEFRFGTTYQSVAPIQVPTGPALSIQRNGSMVTVSWLPATEGFVLQMNDNLTTSGWNAAPAGNPVSLSIGGTAAFFRLTKQ